MKKANRRLDAPLVALVFLVVAPLVLDIGNQFGMLVFPGEFYVENGLRLLGAAVGFYIYRLFQQAARESEAERK